MKYNSLCYILFCILSVTHTQAQIVTENSDWRGYITLNNNTLPFLIHLTKNKESGLLSGACESPQQTQQSYSLHNIQLSDTDAHFEFNAGYGNTLFTGLLHGDSMDGTYTQNKLAGDFQLIKYSTHNDTLKLKPQPNFYEENVSFTYENIVLAGTLSKPGDGLRHPVVILITSSGAQDRDESIYGFKPFKILATNLATNGYAVLRLDDRGVGLSKGKIVDVSTTIELANDIQRAITFLHSRLDVDASHIGLIGHGEGASIAAITSVNDPSIQCIIALSAPTLKGSDILLQQLDSAREPNVSAEVYTINKKLLRYYFSHPGLTQADDTMQFWLSKLQGAKYHELTRIEKLKYTDSVNYVKYMSTVMRAQLFSRWYRFNKDYDPAITWKLVKCPVLAIYASRDKEICSSINKSNLVNITSKNTLYIKTFDGANHFFEKATSGLPSEYSKLSKEFVPGFTEYIINWLKTKI